MMLSFGSPNAFHHFGQRRIGRGRDPTSCTPLVAFAETVCLLPMRRSGASEHCHTLRGTGQGTPNSWRSQALAFIDKTSQETRKGFAHLVNTTG
jgi:hypothetical protein